MKIKELLNNEKLELAGTSLEEYVKNNVSKLDDTTNKYSDENTDSESNN